MFEENADDDNGSIGKSVGFVSVTAHVKNPPARLFASLSGRYDTIHHFVYLISCWMHGNVNWLLGVWYNN
jgi:hypothetical protein